MTLPDLIEQDLNALSISDEVTHTVLAGIEGEFGRLGLGYEKAREYLRPFRGRKYLSLGTGNTSVVATADTLRGKIFVTPFFPGPTPDPNEIARRLDRFVDYLDHHYPRDKDVIIVLPDFYAASMSASNRLSPTGANNRWETLSFQAYQLIRDNF
ncbi:MAG: hypothetical protein HYZ71_03060 [Deltaproteobacteria bacterium]|nr:hypothetical protein [Deltaproteobacteria bacterium]